MQFVNIIILTDCYCISHTSNLCNSDLNTYVIMTPSTSTKLILTVMITLATSTILTDTVILTLPTYTILTDTYCNTDA